MPHVWECSGSLAGCKDCLKSRCDQAVAGTGCDHVTSKPQSSAIVHESEPPASFSQHRDVAFFLQEESALQSTKVNYISSRDRQNEFSH